MMKWLSIRRVLEILIFCLPAVLLIPGISGFPYPGGDGTYSDVSVTHYPNALFFQNSLNRYGEFPLWSSSILSGYPFAANPLSGVWYPFNWLLYLLPLPTGLNLLVLTHLVLGGIGMFLFLRAQNLKQISALIGSIGFLLLPKFYAHFGAGHYSLLLAISWTPWLLRASILRAQGSKNFLQGRPELFIALIMLADIRWAIYVFVFWAAYEISLFFQVDQSAWASAGQKIKLVMNTVLRLCGSSLIAVCLAAPMLLPLIEYTQLSTRVSLNPQDSLTYSLPVERLLGLLITDFGGFHEWYLYPGAVAIILALISFSCQFRNPSVQYWGIWALVSLLFALGSNTPVAPFFLQLPVFDLLRVPPRALFIFIFSLLMLAALGADKLLDQLTFSEIKRIRLLMFGCIVFIICLGLGVFFFSSGRAGEFLYSTIALVSVCFITLMLVNRRISPRHSLVIMTCIGILDLLIVDRSLFNLRPVNEVLGEKQAVAEYLLTDRPNIFRVYSPSYSLPQHTAATYGLQLVDGVDPLQLAGYAFFFSEASGIPLTGYQVTLPPYASGSPSHDNQGYLPDLEKLGWLNTGYVVSDWAMNVTGLKLKKVIDDVYVYHNELVRPRAWVQPDWGEFTGNVEPVEITYWSPNHIEVTTEGPGVLVLSEIYYPGWNARVNDRLVAIRPIYDVLRGVVLEKGPQKIVFKFQPISLVYGLILAAVGLVILLFDYFKRARFKKSKDILEAF